MKCSRQQSAISRQLSAFSRQPQSELEYHLLLARDLEVLAKAGYEQLGRDVTEFKVRRHR